MSYARNILEKYGWTEGKGLGKTENGMVEALKPKLKFDNTGIGHDHAEQFTFNWWEIAFNEAAKRVSVNASKDNPEEQLEVNHDLRISTKRPSITKLMRENSLKYGKFIKTETLTNGGKIVPELRKSTKPKEDDSCPITSSSQLSDDELFKICGGRTAHKAARHGHKLVGKLARVIEQEKVHLTTSESNGKKDGDSELAPRVNFEADGGGHIKKKKKIKKVLMEVDEQDRHCDKEPGQFSSDGIIDRGSPEETCDDGVDSHNSKGTVKKKKIVFNAKVTGPENDTFKGSKGKKRKRCKGYKSDCNHLDCDNLAQVHKDNPVYEERTKKRKKKK